MKIPLTEDLKPPYGSRGDPQGPGGVAESTAALEALLDGQYDHVQELLEPLTPAQLRRLAIVAQDLAHLARAASLRPYLFPEELAGLGTH